MVVLDAGLLKAGIGRRVTEILDQEGLPYVQFSGVEANPTVGIVEAVRELYLREGCGGILALGGGSVMDAAKAAGARVVRPRRSLQQMAGLFKVGKKLPPLIAVPTTSGTGSETTIAALVTDPATHHKYAIMDLRLIPRYAVLDPDLVEGLPPGITAATGMDALTHAVEAYLCRSYNTPESIRDALDAVGLIFENLERAYRNGRDREARQAMMLASYKAGFAFTRSGVGNVHAIAHTLGGLYNTPHGLANAVILPAVLEDYGRGVYKKLARLAEVSRTAPEGASEEGKARAFIAAIYALNERMGIPRRFDFIREEDIPQMSRWAFRESNPLYPVPVIYNEARFRRVIESLRTGRQKRAE
jgi:alcohol dehydrogenase class IV